MSDVLVLNTSKYSLLYCRFSIIYWYFILLADFYLVTTCTLVCLTISCFSILDAIKIRTELPFIVHALYINSSGCLQHCRPVLEPTAGKTRETCSERWIIVWPNQEWQGGEADSYVDCLFNECKRKNRQIQNYRNTNFGHHSLHVRFTATLCVSVW